MFWTLWEKARVGCFRRTASKHVYYLGWNRSPAQVGCMRQGLGPGALGRPRGIGWRGRWEGASGWGTHVNPWLFHFNVWQNSLQIKKKLKKKKLHRGCDKSFEGWREVYGVSMEGKQSRQKETAIEKAEWQKQKDMWEQFWRAGWKESLENNRNWPWSMGAG